MHHVTHMSTYEWVISHVWVCHTWVTSLRHPSPSVPPSTNCSEYLRTSHDTCMRMPHMSHESASPLTNCTADPIWGDTFEFNFKAQSSKLECLFCHVSLKRDVRALSFDLWKSFSKMSPKVGLAVPPSTNCSEYIRMSHVTHIHMPHMSHESASHLTNYFTLHQLRFLPRTALLFSPTSSLYARVSSHIWILTNESCYTWEYGTHNSHVCVTCELSLVTHMNTQKELTHRAHTTMNRVNCVAVCCSVLQCVAVCCSVLNESCYTCEYVTHDAQVCVTLRQLLLNFSTVLLFATMSPLYQCATSHIQVWGGYG